MPTLRLLAFGLLALAPVAARADEAPALKLPGPLKSRAVVLEPTDKDYPRADLPGAIKPGGDGGISRGLVVRLTEDIPVWRMWSGPTKKDSRGNTNRLGSWWSYDAPRGPQPGYRTSYEICHAWNDLTWVARCTLKKGAVVAIGPGQSVSAKTCGDASGKEAYPANDRDWQTYVAKAWTRLGPDKELDCPAETEDYEADLTNIALHKDSAAGAAHEAHKGGKGAHGGGKAHEAPTQAGAAK